MEIQQFYVPERGTAPDHITLQATIILNGVFFALYDGSRGVGDFLFQMDNPGNEGYAILDDDEAVLGAAMITLDTESMYITGPAMRPDSCNQGLEKQLIHHVARIAIDVGCPEIALDVNIRDSQLYTALGFQIHESGQELIADPHAVLTN